MLTVTNFHLVVWNRKKENSVPLGTRCVLAIIWGGFTHIQSTPHFSGGPYLECRKIINKYDLHMWNEYHRVLSDWAKCKQWESCNHLTISLIPAGIFFLLFLWELFMRTSIITHRILLECMNNKAGYLTLTLVLEIVMQERGR